MDTMTMVEVATGRTVDVIGVDCGRVVCVTEAARPVLDALTAAYTRRGVSPVCLVDDLDGWSDGRVRLVASPIILEQGWEPPEPSKLISLDEARSDRKLRAYWRKHIPWGSKGDFTMCVKKLRKHVRDPEGLCAVYHKQFLGFWPGDKRNK